MDNSSEIGKRLLSGRPGQYGIIILVDRDNNNCSLFGSLVTMLKQGGFGLDELVTDDELFSHVRSCLQYTGFKLEKKEATELELAVHYMTENGTINPYHPLAIYHQMDQPPEKFTKFYTERKYLPHLTLKIEGTLLYFVPVNLHTDTQSICHP